MPFENLVFRPQSRATATATATATASGGGCVAVAVAVAGWAGVARAGRALGSQLLTPSDQLCEKPTSHPHPQSPSLARDLEIQMFGPKQKFSFSDT